MVAFRRAGGKKVDLSAYPRNFQFGAPIEPMTRPREDDVEGRPEPMVVESEPGRRSNPTGGVDLRRFRDLSHALDDFIRVPGTRFRIGLEPIVGLLPVVGDAFGVAVSAYALVVAARTGVPRATLARVAVVHWIDAVGGATPIVGDVFDAYWKANRRTVDLLDARLNDPESAAADGRFLRRTVLVVAGFGVVLLATVAAFGWWLAGTI
jgi:hypothetical protein